MKILLGGAAKETVFLHNIHKKLFVAILEGKEPPLLSLPKHLVLRFSPEDLETLSLLCVDQAQDKVIGLNENAHKKLRHSMFYQTHQKDF